MSNKAFAIFAGLILLTFVTSVLCYFVVGSPQVTAVRDTMRIVYYVMGFLALTGLALDTGFEFGMHHRGHAAKVAILLTLMIALFLVANYLFFAPPVLAFLPY